MYIALYQQRATAHTQTRRENKMDGSTATDIVKVPATRGRKPGQKVASLDYRAYILLQDADLAGFIADRDISTRKGERELIAYILATLRNDDDPIF